MIQTYLLVAAGGALGSMGRYWLALAVARLTGPAFPWGTVLINILGSCLIGFLASFLAGERVADAQSWRIFAMVGLCGGFTTFSSFSLQTVDLLREGQAVAAVGNVAGSVLLCLGASFLGLMLGRM